MERRGQPNFENFLNSSLFVSIYVIPNSFLSLGVAAVGSGVVNAGEAVGSAAVSGVTAVGKIRFSRHPWRQSLR